MGSTTSSLVEVSPGQAEHNNVATLMRNTIVRHNDIPFTDYKLLKVYKVNSSSAINEKRKAKIKDIEDELGWSTMTPSDERILFHGTPNAKFIIENGFDVDLCNPKSMFGKGIYLTSLSSKANQYAWGSYRGCPVHKNKACYICTRTMLICKCVMGNECKTVNPIENIPQGFHSVVAIPTSGDDKKEKCGLAYPEFVIPDSDQIEITYYVEYKIVE